MRIAQHHLSIETSPREVREVTHEVGDWLPAKKPSAIAITTERPDDMPAHLTARLTRISEAAGRAASSATD